MSTAKTISRLMSDHHNELQNLLNAFAGYFDPFKDDHEGDRLADLRRHVRRFVIADLALRRHGRRLGVKLPSPSTPSPIVALVEAIRRLKPNKINLADLEPLVVAFRATKSHKLPRANSLQVADKPTKDALQVH